MNNTVYDIDYTKALPPSLKSDENMLALASVIAEELQKTAHMARLNIIYARIDELDEKILDILAYDLHVDWYDYTYPVDAKRALIKDSVKVHKRLGTKFAVETALGNLHPNSKIEEWFEYNGEPFSFRVILDTTNSRVGAGYFEIKKAIDSYKRLSAHLDDLIYQCTIGIAIGIETQAWRFKAAKTGRINSGTTPHREVIGGVEAVDIELQNEVEGFRFESRAAGTSPKRSRIAALRESEIITDPEGKGFGFTAAMAGRKKTGVIPEQNTQAGLNASGITQTITTTAYKYKNKLCGRIVTKNV